MRLFLSEFLCSGAVDPSCAPASLLREGRSMLLALADDLARLDGIEVCTTWHPELGDWPLPAVNALPAGSADEEGVFRRLASECDATYVIAPELDELLLQRCRMVEQAGGTSLNCTLEAIALTGDKLRLWQHLQAAGIPSIPTASLNEADPPEFPCVIKPRCGAGSENTYVVHDSTAYHQACNAVAGDEMIIQPHVAGLPCSIAAVLDDHGGLAALLPPAAQHLSDDGRLKYLGGHCPFDTPLSNALNELVLSTARSIHGLRGYVGFDLLLPHSGPKRPLLVEINPRLTTSYLGYRTLARDNLAAWLLPRSRTTHAPRWRSVRVTFGPDGTIAESPAGTAMRSGTGP